MKGIGVIERSVYSAILRETLLENPVYLGVWAVWEPDALDGRDIEHVNQPGNDASGRFVPVWSRIEGRISLETNCNYDIQGLGDWYFIPKESGAEMVFDPFEFPFASQRVFITSQVAPIFHDGQCVGVAGIDFAVDAFSDNDHAEICEEVLNRGFVFLDESGAISFWSRRTQLMFAKYCPDESPYALPLKLQTLLRQAICTGRPLSPQIFSLRNESLLVRCVKHPTQSRYLLVIEETSAPPAALLSEREREVLQWISMGKSNGEIAIILGISPHTVKRHVEKVLAKLGVESRHAAALVALQP